MTKFLTFLSLALIVGANAFGQDQGSKRKHFNTKRQVAVSGYDPVSYFQDKPEKGSKSIL